MIYTIFRILGIIEDTISVVVVPVSLWRRMQDERDAALERVRILERQMAAMEQER